MLRIRVDGGTRQTSDTSLCVGCRHSTVIQGMTSSQRLFHCSLISRNIPFNVEQCSDFKRFGEPSLGDMKEIATIIEKRPSGSIGFHSPGDWRRKRPNEDVVPGDSGCY